MERYGRLLTALSKKIRPLLWSVLYARLSVSRGG